MGRVSQYVLLAVGLSLVLIAIYASPLKTQDSSQAVDRAMEPSLLTSYSPTPAQRKEILNVERTYEVYRGKDNTFEVSVANPFKDSTIEGLDLTIDGPFAKYMEVEDAGRTGAGGEKIELVRGLGYQETQKYKINVDVPQYIDRGTYFVDLEIHKGNVTYRDYPSIEAGTDAKVLKYKDITFEIIERRTVALNVHTYSEEEAVAAYEEGVSNIGRMQNAGFSTGRAERLLDTARAEMSAGDYEAAIEIGEQISKIQNDAFSAIDRINTVRDIINDAEGVRGLRVLETKELSSLAIAAFERGDYETALERLRDAELVFAIETRGKVNYSKFLLDNIVTVILGTLALLAISIFIIHTANMINRGKMIKGLDTRDGTITKLKLEMQKSYYVDKTVGLVSYKNAMEGFQAGLRENQEKRAKLKARRARLPWSGENLKSLKRERENMKGLIRDCQSQYYHKKTMGKSEYGRVMEQYIAMGADVEEAIAVLELRLFR